MHYLDHNASAPLDPVAQAAMIATLPELSGNPASVHGRGQALRARIDEARRQVARGLGCSPAEIIFTSGASEANSLAISGTFGLPETRRRFVTSVLEHASVLRLAQQWSQAGVELLSVAAKNSGITDISQFAAALPQAGLCSLQLVNSELGTIQPVAQVAALARSHGVRMHSDLTQALGKIAFSLAEFDLDLASVSGHKIGGPAGVGALYVRRGVALQPLQPGFQEMGLRAGTENILGIVAFGAVMAALSDRLAAVPRVRQIRDQLWHFLQTIPDVHRHALVAAEDETGNTLSVAVAGVPSATLVMALDLDGFCISAGSACSSGSLQVSAAIASLRPDDARHQALAQQTVRISLGPETTATDISALTAVLPRIIQRIRDIGPLSVP